MFYVGRCGHAIMRNASPDFNYTLESLESDIVTTQCRTHLSRMKMSISCAVLPGVPRRRGPFDRTEELNCFSQALLLSQGIHGFFELVLNAETLNTVRSFSLKYYCFRSTVILGTGFHSLLLHSDKESLHVNN